MRSLKKVKKNILAAAMLVILLLSSSLSMAGCAKPPEYSEIEDRFIELVEASMDVNKILFGEGLETYERVYDPRSTVKTVIVDEVRYYYYDVHVEEPQRIVAFRSSYIEPYEYMEITEEEKNGEEYDYLNEEEGLFGYLLEGFEEPKYDFYYKESDPEDYDYVRLDSGFGAIRDIKEYAEKVYSKNYLEKTVYESLFDGIAPVIDGGDLEGRTARYYEYTDSDGITSLMMLNTYDPIYPSDKIVFDFSTAKIVKPYRKDFVNISISYYYENAPEKSYEIKVSMVVEDGVWKLDSQTF